MLNLIYDALMASIKKKCCYHARLVKTHSRLIEECTQLAKDIMLKKNNNNRTSSRVTHLASQRCQAEKKKTTVQQELNQVLAFSTVCKKKSNSALDFQKYAIKILKSGQKAKKYLPVPIFSNSALNFAYDKFESLYFIPLEQAILDFVLNFDISTPYSMSFSNIFLLGLFGKGCIIRTNLFFQNNQNAFFKKKKKRSIFISFSLMSTEKPPFAATENFWISATNLEKK